MSIFNSTEIRTILRKHITGLPKRGRGEITKIADHLSVSTTLISQVLSGDRIFTAEQAQLLSAYLGYSALEAEYLLFLVMRDRAGTKELRKFWSTRLETIRAQSQKVTNRVSVDRILSEQERSVFYSSPVYSAICLFVTVGQSGKSAEEVAERFRLPRTKTMEILRFLTTSGLCKIENERYVMGLQKTHLEAGSPFLPRHHCNWRLRAIQRSEDLGEDELMYTAPVSLSRKDFEILREEMMQLIQSFLNRVHASPAEEIACLNLDFLWFKS